jgi:signal transduction histidine kinase
MKEEGAARSGLLLDVARLVAEASGPDQLLQLLAEVCTDPAGVGANAAAVLRVESDGRVRLAMARGLPASLSGWSQEMETLDAELGEQLRAAWGATDRDVQTFPLVSGRDIYGAIVIFSAKGERFADEQVKLAEGLADLVAVAMDKAARYTALSQSYAELRASREALAKSEKLRALGEMAAGISHDLKNILNPLGLQLELLRRRVVKDPAEALIVIGHMEEAVRSGVDVVERLRAFSRQAPEAQAEAVDLNVTVTTAVELCRPRIKGATLDLRCEPGQAPPVQARRSELVTAVVNLVFNAIEAMPSGGAIVLRTGAADGGGWIEVADDGPGMSPEIEKRVFEPFFTTKAQGTGLGLAMVYAFVKRHDGRLTLETKEGAGTRFRLWFPRSSAAAAQA